MRICITALIALLAAPGFADSLVGSWTLSIDSPRGVQTPLLVVKQAGDALTGVYHSNRGVLAIDVSTSTAATFHSPWSSKYRSARSTCSTAARYPATTCRG